MIMVEHSATAGAVQLLLTVLCLWNIHGSEGLNIQASL